MLLPPLTTLDLSARAELQTVVDREPGQYLGHPTTVLLRDGRTILCVYPKGHGKGAILMKKSVDGGRTWSERLSTPKSWETSLETPTIHRLIDPKTKRERLLLWSGLYPARTSLSEDEGRTWTELAPVGNWGGIVVMSALERLTNGDYLGLFHDDGRFFGPQADGGLFRVYKTLSRDGGKTWSFPETIASEPGMQLCEPGIVRSPDGETLAVLLRENGRKFHSQLIVSRDEGETWSRPRSLPRVLTGDRHTAKYAPDGRLVISYRDMAPDSPWKGDWILWVGRFQDLMTNRDGQYKVRLMDNTNEWDSSYPGVEVLKDGTIVATTYGHWTQGESPYIVSVRLKLSDLDNAR